MESNGGRQSGVDATRRNESAPKDRRKWSKKGSAKGRKKTKRPAKTEAPNGSRGKTPSSSPASSSEKRSTVRGRRKTSSSPQSSYSYDAKIFLQCPISSLETSIVPKQNNVKQQQQKQQQQQQQPKQQKKKQTAKQRRDDKQFEQFLYKISYPTTYFLKRLKYHLTCIHNEIEQRKENRRYYDLSKKGSAYQCVSTTTTSLNGERQESLSGTSNKADEKKKKRQSRLPRGNQRRMTRSHQTLINDNSTARGVSIKESDERCEDDNQDDNGIVLRTSCLSFTDDNNEAIDDGGGDGERLSSRPRNEDEFSKLGDCIYYSGNGGDGVEGGGNNSECAMNREEQNAEDEDKMVFKLPRQRKKKEKKE